MAEINAMLAQDNIKNKFESLLGKRSVGFISNILQITNSNTLLKKADPVSIINAAMVSATLNLPINPNLGFAYIVPYNQSYKDENDKWQKKTIAQFQMGYKGFIQLAQRSGQFKTLSATPIYEGQIVVNNPLTGVEFNFNVEPKGLPIGYVSYFKLLNGFEKTLYMSENEAKAHATRYSQTYKENKGNWKENFDAMALKTVIKALLSKYAPLSVDMEIAHQTDQGLIKSIDGDNIDVDYIDNQDEATSATVFDFNESRSHTLEKMLKCDDILDLESLKASALIHALNDEYENKFQELMPSK